MPKMSFPKLEDEKGNLENFLAKVEAWYKVYKIDNPNLKIFILGNQLTNSAGIWWANKLRADPEHKGIIFRDWPLFCRRLREQFGQQDPHVDAFARLYHLRMLDDSPGSATKYVERFRDLMIQAGLPEDSKSLWMFQKGLTEEMIKHFERHQPEELYQWYDEVTRIGRNKEAMARLRKLGATSTASSRSPVIPAKGGTTLRPLLSSGATGPATRRVPLPYRAPPVPTTTAAAPTSGPTLSGPRVCYNCGKPGHLASGCPETKVPRVFYAGGDQMVEPEDHSDGEAEEDMEAEALQLEDDAVDDDAGNGQGAQH
jgi:hypothetical protein